jgi:hypothetical protein
MHTLADTLEGLNTCLPAFLFAPRAAVRLREAAAQIPSALAAAFGFECRLQDDDRVDLLYCTVPSGAAALAEAQPVLRGFAAAWPACVPDVWVEHDLDGPHARPSVFFHLRDAAVEDIAGLSRLLDVPLSEVDRQFVATVIDALPADAALDQVGWMLSRPGAPLRCVVRLPCAGVVGWLRRVGWPGDLAAVESAVAFLAAHCDYIVIGLDTCSETLGLEAHFRGRRQPSVEPRWATLLQALVAAEVCRPAKRDALLALPRSVADPSMLLTDCLLILTHVKVTVPAGGAKAYFGFLRVPRC